MALATPCQTPGAVYSTHVTPDRISCSVELPPEVRAALGALSEQDAAELETTLHNAIELALAPLWRTVSAP